jgi:hypothetical protein
MKNKFFTCAVLIEGTDQIFGRKHKNRNQNRNNL